ncbi:hypothetical protein [Variovorax saccharolyticus]|uniref:hypothetical protein n=1 Tax=Variovorax saccharolyticus TaxID=3053516 RepID=UPI002574F4D7|nr:hypothetical protein [Variovorax sp. J31P216]MDM0029702.1 hypothetical protein [Variovorax sp. J31P216]
MRAVPVPPVELSLAIGVLGIALGMAAPGTPAPDGVEIEPVPCVEGNVPVVPIGVPVWLCWPAAVAGLGEAVLGGVPCADASPEIEIKAKALAEVARMCKMGERFMK